MAEKDAPIRLSIALINRGSEVGKRPPLVGTPGMEDAGSAMASIRDQAEDLLASLEGLYPNNPDVVQLRQLLDKVLSEPAALPYGPELEEEGLSSAALRRPSLGMGAPLGEMPEEPPMEEPALPEDIGMSAPPMGMLAPPTGMLGGPPSSPPWGIPPELLMALLGQVGGSSGVPQIPMRLGIQ